MIDPKLGFELKRIRLKLESILPIRKHTEADLRAERFRKILASVKEIGVIEPLMVYPQKGIDGMYVLLDGHIRYHALKELGHSDAECLVSTDDEGFTYNARVSRLSPIQEHKMITKAVQNGVSAQRIAAALNMNVKEVQASMRLLDGIHEEAADLLKDKAIFPQAIKELKKVSGVRQIEMAELMVSTNNYTRAYAEALVVGTPKNQMAEPEKPKTRRWRPEEIAKLEHEMESLERDFKAVEQTYGENMLQFTILRGYVKKLLENGKVVRFLSSRNADLLSEFESIVATEAI
jgi:hypothetical protein